MTKQISLFVSLLMTLIAHSQCPTITVPSTFTLTNCQTGNTISAVSNYSANITSRWIGPGNIPIASIGTATSIVYLNYPETYSVEFMDNSSNCIVTETVQIWDVFQRPSFNLSASNFSLLCTSSSITVNFVNAATLPPGGPVSFTLIPPGASSVLPSGMLSLNATYTIGSCGMWEAVLKDVSNSCNASYRFSISCSTLNPTPLIASGNNTVCSGSSVTYTSNGSNHLWNTGATTSTMNVIPYANTTYSVTGTDANSCPSSGTIAVVINTTCSDVWPGDANSDGLVDNLDVFELGLAMTSNGPVRTPGGNVYNSQFANNWTGTVSAGKSLCHADCDGNGLINLNDTLAIFNNFLQPHAFKSSESTLNNPDIFISSSPIVSRGAWNKATINLGDNTNSISQILGLAFSVNYDPSMIEADSVYLVYPSSFLNNSGQNIQFRKNFFNAGKMYGTSIRSNGANVNGSGAIAEFYFKVKSDVAENSIMNFSLSDVKKINAAKNLSGLSAGTLNVLVDGNTVGINKETENKISISCFPNPGSSDVTFFSNSKEKILYRLYAMNGQQLMQETFTNSVKVDITEYASGTYFVEFEQSGFKAYKKLIIAN